MRNILCALNAKYIHSNLAVHYLKEYARFYLGERKYGNVNDNDFPQPRKIEILIEEYSINQHFNEIMADIYQKKPDRLFFSCYIWNVSMILELVVDLKKVLPSCDIWLGGPEVSFDSVGLLKGYHQLKGIVIGEGEQAFTKIIGNVRLDEIAGITYRDSQSQIIGSDGNNCYDKLTATWRKNETTMDKIPFPYKDMEKFKNKIVYYESSRGCPFSCSYCLSSVAMGVQFRSIELVKQELKYFIDSSVKQVKFVDRTFNCNNKRAREIWDFIHKSDRGKTDFHMEIAADLLGDKDFEILKKLRPGLIQFEIGVQSTNVETLIEINREMIFSAVAKSVGKIKSFGNIHLHLDLIAGLPKEDYQSFANSFNEVYALKPDKLQLGFLKVLNGSVMKEKVESYKLIYQEKAPYEVLSTAWLTYLEILCLKRVEEMVEVYYNSGQFENTLTYLEQFFESPFKIFESLGDYYLSTNQLNLSHSRQRRYEILMAFVSSIGMNICEKRFRQMLIFDYYLKENAKKRPEFAGEETVRKEEAEEFYSKEMNDFNFLKGYESFNKRKMRNMTHLEKTEEGLYLFDYHNWDASNKQAKVYKVK